MILIDVNRQEYDNDTRNLIKAFYPKEDISNKNEEDYLMKVKVNQEGNVCKIDIEDAEGKDIYNTAITITTSDRKIIRTDFKLALYDGLSDITGKTLPWGTLTGVRPTKIPLTMIEEGKKDDDIIKHMKDAYKCSDEKTKLSLEVAKRERSLLNRLDYENGYSLYIGIPFCPTTCLYCSFTSYPLGMWKKEVDSYLDAMIKELEFVADRFSDKVLDTIYVGGGTPTTLDEFQLDRLLGKVEELFDLSHLKEITVEAGRPDSITKEKLEVIKKHNISRISINPQTMKQETLNLIGRHHTVEQVISAYHLARDTGFDNINMDLIVGLPGERIDDVRMTMEKLKELDPDSITVHSLAIKRASRLNILKEQYKDYEINNTDEIINLTRDYAYGMGMTPYYLYRQKNMAGNFENVGYAKPHKAGIYNILIMEEKQTIIAVGAGASTKVVFKEENRIERIENVKDVRNYIDRIDEMIDRKRTFFSEKY
ncbi:MAG: coproporphyrinogen dehydrogenase HemZ [Lachnospiraceae bacterium]|uniref:coproporphyrinogen dehydrogenase HemZ n=1 Tax=Falcatimonas sp. MSJ-15 TaxID=2841515 RepID=UPI001C11DC48|nr:coproporphyrinogen dehydrogenase HemZ [Falcatimonas sp. MSJ-15]MBQ5734704.1 coproporphyrinogen dehydrogenase HemZ [Lachnospiraceae bacterium]MBU5468788.1 coproporphyrinogen dehydrogenase HemZ [Falcatimonas sp. MSJ-15]MEE0958730.1 coproporphyrinogen dehydrogenase HemZ [Lachnospiraceae bacterium]